MKPGSKYYPLFTHLQTCYPHDTVLTFAELETLLGTKLPASARTRKNWWRNHDSQRALQAGAWIGAGYHVEAVDLQQQVVTFQRFQAQYTIQHQDGTIVWHLGQDRCHLPIQGKLCEF